MDDAANDINSRIMELQKHFSTFQRVSQSREMEMKIRKAHDALELGNTEKLINLLKDENFKLSIAIRYMLVSMLDGSAELNLKVVTRSDIARVVTSEGPKREDYRLGVQVAKYIASKGGFENGMTESAFNAAQSHFGFGRTKITKYWSQHKALAEAEMRGEISIII